MITANCNWFNCLECFLKLKPKRLTSENVVVVLWSYSHVLVYALILLNKLHLFLQMVILLPKAPLLLLQSLLFIVTRKCGPLRFSLTLIDFFQRTAKDAIHSPSFLSQLDQGTVLVRYYRQPCQPSGPSCSNYVENSTNFKSKSSDNSTNFGRSCIRSYVSGLVICLCVKSSVCELDRWYMTSFWLVDSLVVLSFSHLIASFCPGSLVYLSVSITTVFRLLFCFVRLFAYSGQRFAFLEVKIVLSYVLHNFSIASTQTIDELHTCSELITRPKEGIFVTLAKR